MIGYYQMELGKPIPTENELLWEEIKRLHESLDRVRKGTYSRIGEIKKEVTEANDELHFLKKHICERVK